MDKHGHELQRAWKKFEDAIDSYDDDNDNYEWIDNLDGPFESIRLALCKKFGHWITYQDHCGRFEHDRCEFCNSYREVIEREKEEVKFDFRLSPVEMLEREARKKNED